MQKASEERSQMSGGNMTRQSPRTVGFGVRVTGHAGAHIRHECFASPRPEGEVP
jgi:hypothetical protein